MWCLGRGLGRHVHSLHNSLVSGSHLLGCVNMTSRCCDRPRKPCFLASSFCRQTRQDGEGFCNRILSSADRGILWALKMCRNLIPSHLSEAAGGWLVKEICTGSSFSSLTSAALNLGIASLADDISFAYGSFEKESLLLARHVQEIHNFLGFIKNPVFNNFSSVTDEKKKLYSHTAEDSKLSAFGRNGRFM